MSTNITTEPFNFQRVEESTMRERAQQFCTELTKRRTVREFSSEPVALDVVRTCIQSAAQAPSGANKQPWTFVLVTDPEVKHKIRIAAEEEERAFYAGRASEQWIKDLAPLGTDEHKPFLDTAPCLIVVFAQRHGLEGEKHYYVSESVGIACGFLIAALHHAGLVTLTHTPSPMGFLSEILDRPANERAYLLIPVGYPSPGCTVPMIERKPLSAVLVER